VSAKQTNTALVLDSILIAVSCVWTSAGSQSHCKDLFCVNSEVVYWFINFCVILELLILMGFIL